jgi:polyhydroxybutyrate depolymerase
VTSSYPVDTARVYLVGHSNGGFMAHRMACEHASVIAAIVSLAGLPPMDVSQCTPERPVSVLQIHGTDDAIIPFDGGANSGRGFPSVDTALGMWRGRNGCTDQADTSASLDLESDLPGAETTVTTYRDGCRDATSVELWSIEAGSHVPAFTAEFAPAIVDFLYAHASPS